MKLNKRNTSVQPSSASLSSSKTSGGNGVIGSTQTATVVSPPPDSSPASSRRNNNSKGRWSLLLVAVILCCSISSLLLLSTFNYDSSSSPTTTTSRRQKARRNFNNNMNDEEVMNWPSLSLKQQGKRQQRRDSYETKKFIASKNGNDSTSFSENNKNNNEAVEASKSKIDGAETTTSSSSSYSSDDKDELKQLVGRRKGGVIYGNPLLNSYCKNVLLDVHGYKGNRRNIFNKNKNSKNMIDPFFISREALNAMTQSDPNRQHYFMKNLIRTNWVPNDDNNNNLATIEENTTAEQQEERDTRRLTSRNHERHQPERRQQRQKMMMMMMMYAKRGPRRKPQQNQEQQPHMKSKTSYISTYNDNSSKITYVMLGKCASSSISQIFEILEEQNDETYGTTRYSDYGKSHHNYVSLTKSDCTFTFVRDPIKRLISAYSTINSLISKGSTTLFTNRNKERQKLYKIWSFVNIKDEPKRFITFINNLLDNPNEFTSVVPFPHVFSQSGKLGYFNTPFHFIGRVESFDDHWNILSKHHPYNDHCTNFLGKMDADKLPHANKKSTTRKKGTKEQKQTEAEVALRYQTIFNNQNLFNRLVEHYWQDYVCFGYSINYSSADYNINYTGTFQYPF